MDSMMHIPTTSMLLSIWTNLKAISFKWYVQCHFYGITGMLHDGPKRHVSIRQWRFVSQRHMITSPRWWQRPSPTDRMICSLYIDSMSWGMMTLEGSNPDWPPSHHPQSLTYWKDAMFLDFEQVNGLWTVSSAVPFTAASRGGVIFNICYISKDFLCDNVWLTFDFSLSTEIS